MLKTKKILNSLRKLLQSHSQPVSEIEVTFGNYDQGKVIPEGVPTITTDVCEIGIYNNTYYFTVVLRSELFSKHLFDDVKNLESIHIYGFKNFLEDYYPSDNFSFQKLENQIKSEIYFQIEFIFSVNKIIVKEMFKRYLELQEVFKKYELAVVNQLEVNLLSS